jgi:hypothetical protein
VGTKGACWPEDLGPIYRGSGCQAGKSGTLVRGSDSTRGGQGPAHEVQTTYVGIRVPPKDLFDYFQSIWIGGDRYELGEILTY